MRFAKVSAFVLGLLFATCAQADELVSQKCAKAGSLTECVDSIDSELTDHTKCLPIVVYGNEEKTEVTFGTSSCSSWRDIQNDSTLSIDYANDQALLSA